MDENEIKRIAQIYRNKCKFPEFTYFKNKGLDYFIQWYSNLDKACYYCGIEENKIKYLFESERLSTKRKRGKHLELERIDSSTNIYNEDNCKLACYFCNNHKSDIITREEHAKYFSSSIYRYLNDLYSDIINISDELTNFVYLSDLLIINYPTFYNRIVDVFNKHNINYAFLGNTKDIWAVDYMPIQISTSKFIQFIYEPDYLINDPTFIHTLSDPDIICSHLGIKTIKTDIKADGGNFVRNSSKLIMTSKIFSENPDYPENKLLSTIESLLNLNLIIIPKEKNDLIGHSDGMVRFLDNDTVLMNDYSKEKDTYYQELRMSLRNAGLSIINLPYNPYNNKNYLDATGLYINYLQLHDFIILPIFDLPEDELAYNIISDIFSDHTVIPLKSNEISKDGGVLNCITWNILK